MKKLDKVLILSASAGAGHMRAAQALEKVFVELNAANDATSVVVAPMRVIVYLKLRAGRRKDHNDIVQLVKMGCVDVPSLHEYIDLHVGDMDMLAEFDELAREGEER